MILKASSKNIVILSAAGNTHRFFGH